jgi:hypothetical protein
MPSVWDRAEVWTMTGLPDRFSISLAPIRQTLRSW